MKILIYSALSPETEFQPIQLNLIKLIKKRLMQFFDVIMWNFFNKCTGRYYNWKELCETNKGDLAIRLAIMEQLRGYFKDKKIFFLEIAWGKLSDNLIKKINDEYDLVVIAGGGYYIHDKYGNMNKIFTKDIVFFRKMKKPVVAIGIGMNRNLSEDMFQNEIELTDKSKRLLYEFNSLCRISTVRDYYSSDLLKRIGVNREIQVMPDPVLFLKEKNNTVFFDKTKIKIGLNFACHGFFTQSIIRKKMKTFINFLKKIDEIYNCKFYYFLHADSEKYIVKMIQLKGIEIEIIDKYPSEMLDYYKILDVHICEMMHSSILSLNAGIPTISLAYDIKNISLFNLMGLSDYCFNIHKVTADQLVEKIEEIITDRKILRQTIIQKKIEVKRMLDKIYEQMPEIIQNKQD